MRLIDGDALKTLIIRRRKEAKTLTGIDMVMVIDDAPTVDAVPVTRCKDCKNRDNTVLCPIAHFLCYCNALNVYERNIYAPDDFFCANGERKDDGTDNP